PRVPVVVISGDDARDTAEKALKRGAVNFLSKPFDAAEVRWVFQRVKAALTEESAVLPAVKELREGKTAREIGNDTSVLGKLVAFLGHELEMHYPRRAVPATEVKLALYEALANSIEHGNLEIDYEAKTKALETTGGVTALIETRRREERFRDRRVRVSVEYG